MAKSNWWSMLHLRIVKFEIKTVFARKYHKNRNFLRYVELFYSNLYKY